MMWVAVSIVYGSLMLTPFDTLKECTIHNYTTHALIDECIEMTRANSENAMAEFQRVLLNAQPFPRNKLP